MPRKLSQYNKFWSWAVHIKHRPLQVWAYFTRIAERIIDIDPKKQALNVAMSDRDQVEIILKAVKVKIARGHSRNMTTDNMVQTVLKKESWHVLSNHYIRMNGPITQTVRPMIQDKGNGNNMTEMATRHIKMAIAVLILERSIIETPVDSEMTQILSNILNSIPTAWGKLEWIKKTQIRDCKMKLPSQKLKATHSEVKNLKTMSIEME